MGGIDPRQVQIVSLTDVGRVRSSNQDAYGEFVNAGRGCLLLVADGMGGHRGGEIASKLAVEAVERVFERSAGLPERMLRSALEGANERIYEHAQRERHLEGMGTTAVAFYLGRDGTAWVAHVGDSRLYRLRGGELERLTEDHSVVGELTRHGYLSEEEAANHPRRNELLRSVGPSSTVAVDLAPVSIQSGDRFLLCSDGLCGYVSDPQIQEALGRVDPEEAARALVDLANDSGGQDNVTVQVLVVP